MWRKFKGHRLAILGGVLLLVFYAAAIFCEFIAPYNPAKRHSDYLYCPPQRIRFFDEGRFHLRPFVYAVKGEMDYESFRMRYTVDRSEKHYIYLCVRGERYRFWNLFTSDIHLFGTMQGTVFLFGTDKLGRDLFSLNVHASRVSLSIGLVGVLLSFVLGCMLGGVSGYYGGVVDTAIQRAIEFLVSIPTIPLWMGLAAALPPEWPPLKVYFGITIILSIVSWGSLARVVRGKLLEIREEDFVMAARISGLKDRTIITAHLLPSFASYLIVSLTLSIPGMILGETSLSFLGLGLRSPTVSWGVLLMDAQSTQTVVLHPWLLFPAIFVVLTVLAFNFLGDGLRDAADPYR
jgi:peptide/nickel transport system permease protein